jgi:hypothetical protein
MYLQRMTYDLRVFVFEHVGFHIPDDLMSEKLRELRSLHNITLNISQSIISKSLDNLRDVKERDIDRMALQCPHGVL